MSCPVRPGQRRKPQSGVRSGWGGEQISRVDFSRRQEKSVFKKEGGKRDQLCNVMWNRLVRRWQPQREQFGCRLAWRRGGLEAAGGW